LERIGEFLVRIGVMTREQVEIVLERQKKEPDKLFGEIAIEFNFINDEAIEAYFKAKEAKQ
jgi:hypothetical protein